MENTNDTTLDLEPENDEVLDDGLDVPTEEETPHYPRLSEQEELQLLEQARNGSDPSVRDEARARLVEANMGLVLFFARKAACVHIEVSDLIQEGCLGLLTAIDKFDPTMGNRLGTYATYWIRQSIARAVANHSRLIRTPVHVHDSLRKIKAMQTVLVQYLEHQPTSLELSIALTMSPVHLKEHLKLGTSLLVLESRLSAPNVLQPSDVERILDAEVTMDSLDRVISENTEACVGDFVADPHDSPADALNHREQTQQLMAFVETLDERSRFIVESYYGLNNHQEQSLESIGRLINLTRERVRQLLNEALRRLRVLCEQNDFADYRY